MLVWAVDTRCSMPGTRLARVQLTAVFLKVGLSSFNSFIMSHNYLSEVDQYNLLTSVMIYHRGASLSEQHTDLLICHCA